MKRNKNPHGNNQPAMSASNTHNDASSSMGNEHQWQLQLECFSSNNQ